VLSSDIDCKTLFYNVLSYFVHICVILRSYHSVFLARDDAIIINRNKAIGK